MTSIILRDRILRIIAVAGLIAIGIVLIYFAHSHQWPSTLQLAVLAGSALIMYGLSLYSYHTPWGKYVHGPLLFAAMLLIPLGVVSFNAIWSPDSLNPLMMWTWRLRDQSLLVFIFIQLIFCVGAWWYCKSMASVAGLTFSIYELYFWVVRAIGPMIISASGAGISQITFDIGAGILFYGGLIVFSYLIQKKFYALANLTRWIGLTAIGVKTILIFRLFAQGLWLGMLIWLAIDAAIITYGLRKGDDSFVIGGVLALFGFAVMAVARYTEALWPVGSIYLQGALIASAFIFLGTMLFKQLTQNGEASQ